MPSCRFRIFNSGAMAGVLRSLGVIAVMTFANWTAARADTPNCPATAAKSAETEVGKLANWNSLYKAFRRYKTCDDGAIGEGFSDRVTTLLSTKWGSLPQLGQLIVKDGAFAAFVFDHVDETADPANLEKIVSNAHKHGCPGLRKSDCSKLRSQAEAALAALASIRRDSKRGEIKGPSSVSK